MNDETPLAASRQAGNTEVANTHEDEETLVADDRASLTPSQIVEQKLMGRLKATPLLVSHVQRQLKPSPR